MTRHWSIPFLLVLVLIALWGCASGSTIITGTVRAPISPEQVTIYLETPADFEVIGLVNASSDAGWTEQGSLNYAVEELKKQAAQLGANGVLLVSFGETITGFIQGVTVKAKIVQGKAIFVNRK
ncbi:MAG: hypothetical protein LBQ75_03175 [Zoogloeaceae bacterium]|jgi:hypothetical protein|nr:hypothetical protein [Zoogloeaceae bacterium]